MIIVMDSDMCNISVSDFVYSHLSGSNCCARLIQIVFNMARIKMS